MSKQRSAPISDFEIPQDRLIVLRKQREPAHFVLSPRADVRRCQVAHIVHVEAKKRSHFGFRDPTRSAHRSEEAARTGSFCLEPTCRCASLSSSAHCSCRSKEALPFRISRSHKIGSSF